ncbi:MAG TPA: alpha/beta hydrolase [Candidatus Limnocylindria bacterium]|nr:alpha/beta hydrolase [Candidatus Limnocylindria bacterium]
MSFVLAPLILVVLVVAGFLFLTWLTQRSLLYFPGPGPVSRVSDVLPGAEEVELVTDDGIRLGAWFVPASERAAGMTVLVCNGNAGDRSSRAVLARGLADEGYAVLLFDYRGFAGNPGAPTEAGLHADARAALAYLISRPGVDPSRIVYFGESLGAAVAAQLASERPPFALVLRSPFPSLAEAGRVHYPYLPVIDPLLMDRYRVSAALAGLRVPVLVVAGDRDTVVPIALSRKVHDDLRAPKRLVVVPGMEHNDPEIAEGPTLIGEVARFIDDVAAGALR